jgi:hypothetical protein
MWLLGEIWLLCRLVVRKGFTKFDWLLSIHTQKQSEKKKDREQEVWYPTASPPSGLSTDGSQVYVDAHILSTPVIADFNHDGLENELIVPVNFYFDQKRYVFNFQVYLTSKDMLASSN